MENTNLENKQINNKTNKPPTKTTKPMTNPTQTEQKPPKLYKAQIMQN